MCNDANSRPQMTGIEPDFPSPLPALVDDVEEWSKVVSPTAGMQNSSSKNGSRCYPAVPDATPILVRFYVGLSIVITYGPRVENFRFFYSVISRNSDIFHICNGIEI